MENSHLEEDSVLPKSWMSRPKAISDEAWNKAQTNMRSFFDNAPILSKIPANADEIVLEKIDNAKQAVLVKLADPVLHARVKVVVDAPGILAAKAKAKVASKIPSKVKALWAKYK